MVSRALPDTDDPDTGGHWAAARDGQIAIRRCNDCHTWLHLPRRYCYECRGWNTSWHTVGPTATLYSYTTTERALRPGFEAPYTVVVVELDDAPGVRLFGHLPGRQVLTIGHPMIARFEVLDATTTIVSWDPA